jgi:predicted lipid-binding transport protein (Tim44 family)
MAADSSFAPREFLQGARAAYEMIVMAFARGDRKALKDLLSKEVFDGFSSVITQREQNNLKAEATFVSLDKANIVEAELKGKTMEVTVKFASKLINATRDAAGTVVEGSAEAITDVVDIWTFARDAGSRDPNWRLVATETGH